MWKLIDGILYKSTDVSADNVLAQLSKIEELAKPNIDGIISCKNEIKRLEEQINAYKQNINNIINQNNIDKDMIMAVAPERVDKLIGFFPENC